MKRDSDREEGEIESEEDSVAANCLMLLSRVGEGSSASSGEAAGQQPQTVSPGRVFECKTCNRQFSSFQALGGHRASHKKPRLDLVVAPSSPPKPKMHACAICGEEFPIGQALGGHMRRHRPASAASGDLKPPPKRTVPVLKKSSSGKRVFCVDLNLTPMENDLKLEFGRLAPVI